MKNSVEHPRRKSREAVMMALYALEIHNNVNEKSETGPLPSASILDDILSRKSFDDDQKKYIELLFNLLSFSGTKSFSEATENIDISTQSILKFLSLPNKINVSACKNSPFFSKYWLTYLFKLVFKLSADNNWDNNSWTAKNLSLLLVPKLLFP